MDLFSGFFTGGSPWFLYQEVKYKGNNVNKGSPAYVQTLTRTGSELQGIIINVMAPFKRCYTCSYMYISLTKSATLSYLLQFLIIHRQA